MSFKATEQPGGSFADIEPLEAGGYPAHLIGVSIVGLHAQSYLGEAKEPKISIALTYELSDEFLKDEEGNDLTDKPRFLTENMPFHNLSNDKAKSTLRYKALDPVVEYDGDWIELLGTACIVNVVQNAGKGKNVGRTFNNISNVTTMRPKEASKMPDPVNPAFSFDFYEPTKEAWDRAPARVKYLAKDALDFHGTPMEEWFEAFEQNKDQAIKIEESPPKKTRIKVKASSEDNSDENW